MAAMSCFSLARLPISSTSSSTRNFSCLTKPHSIQRSCKIVNTTEKLEEPPRRSANYHPTIWDHSTIQSIESLSSLKGNTLERRRELLKNEVKLLLDASDDPLAQLQLIDTIQRLGIAYHFDNEIKSILDRIHDCHVHLEALDCVHKTALAFRLLRQHGYDVSSDVFQKYRDSQGFKDSLTDDVKGLLSLYEASFLSFPGEQLMEEANKFSVRHLESLTQKVGLDIEEQVRHSLQVPLHRRMRRLEAREYIDVYQREEGKSSVLLEFAKVDFNFVQIIHQMELKELSKWWISLNLDSVLSFIRDRLVENYLWAIGFVYEPHMSKCRIGITKAVCILSVIDDVYDIYGSFEEVEILTKTIKSWDPHEMRNLPENIKLCYKIIYSFIEEITTSILLDNGCNVMPFLKKEWENLCGSYLVEAKWFHEGYTPSLKEYLKNAWISIGGPMTFVFAYCLLGHTLGDNSLNCLKQGFDPIYWSSLILRLNDDLGTSKAEMERGDTPKSIQCHMRETGESEEVSREYIKNLVDHFWKELNQESIRTHLPKNFMNLVTNMALASHCIFQFGDGIGDSTGITKNRILSLFVNNVPLE
uniref:Monoterpene synthase n=1 Tax=Lilium hybrid cultivar TaxID=156531 RepID=A0A6M2RCU9_9LILI|nr:monoterpene synthase [Lilium hybrid cultivar]